MTSEFGENFRANAEFNLLVNILHNVQKLCSIFKTIYAKIPKCAKVRYVMARLI